MWLLKCTKGRVFKNCFSVSVSRSVYNVALIESNLSRRFYELLQNQVAKTGRKETLLLKSDKTLL